MLRIEHRLSHAHEHDLTTTHFGRSYSLGRPDVVEKTCYLADDLFGRKRSDERLTSPAESASDRTPALSRATDDRSVLVRGILVENRLSDRALIGENVL